jgi:murein L,D-transpeptidase YcbB/YkuD
MLGGGALCLGLGVEAAAAQSSGGGWTFPGFGPANLREEQNPKPRVREPLNDLRPDPIPWRSDEMLAKMEAAIGRYQRVVANGGWPQISSGPMLRLDDDGERVVQLRRRLAASGDLQGNSAYSSSRVFDDRLEAAVRNFQDRSGLRVTGRVDRPTLAQLNGSAAARLEQLKLNQRRIMELMQGRVEDRYILVNAAAFQLEAVEGYEVRRRHRVIVGKADRQTPTVKATIKALNFFPYWRVPESVAGLDLIPRLQREPDYLQKELIRAFAPNGTEIDARSIDWTRADPTKIRFRQDPGPQNALGLVRIDMPNEHVVYMHDTPLKPLFNQRARAFSAGCVRVQDVFELVEWIARFEPGWDRPGRAQEIVDAGQPLDVTLTRQMPVYFTYLTAWAEGDGVAVFRPDVYGRDGSRELVGERDPDAPPPPQSLAP